MREPFTHLRRPRRVPGVPRKRGSQGQPRWQSKAYAFGRIFPARCGSRLFGDGHAANARERHAPRGARRSDAGEDIGARWVCPYVESSLQKSVGGNGLKKRPFPTFCLTAREWRERGPSPRKTILASFTRAMRVPTTHQRKPPSAASATRGSRGNKKPKAGNVMCKITGPAMVHDR